MADSGQQPIARAEVDTLVDEIFEMLMDTSAYDIVRQHTMSHVSIQCRTSAYDIAYDMQHVGDNMGAAWGAEKSVQAFLARLLEGS